MQNVQKWKILRSHFVLDNQWCRVRQDKIELPNGEAIDDFFINVRPDIALVFAVTKNREIVFVRQYRHGVGEILLELPGGAFDPETENAESAAMREMREETGYVCQKLIKLATLHDNPVKDTNKIHLFFAQDVEKSGEQILDATEEIEVLLVPVAEVTNKILTGEICVSGTVAAVFLGLIFLNNIGISN